ncbi:MAG: Uma2 family endonuclease [Acidobacteriaceae bacterium]|nr:Uma2 family endonuclease [Acidobacteriaceae bacterium]
MATAPNFASFDEYMQTSYSPDCEYIDGVILERNVGQGRHAFTQGKLTRKLSEEADSRLWIVLPEQRVRVAAGRVRVPDVCVVDKLEEVISKPPLLCVEVLSPDDRWTRVNASIADYQEMGVPYVWVIDPYRSRAWIFELDNPPLEVRDGRLTAAGVNIEIQLADVLPPPE